MPNCFPICQEIKSKNNAFIPVYGLLYAQNKGTEVDSFVFRTSLEEPSVPIARFSMDLKQLRTPRIGSTVMLMIERSAGESLSIGGLVNVVVTSVKGKNKVKLGIQAPKHIPIVRNEVPTSKQEQLNDARGLRLAFIESDSEYARKVINAVHLHGLHNVQHYTTAGDAIAGIRTSATKNEQPQVVLLDYSLPGVSGDSVIQEIRKLPGMRHVPMAVLGCEQSAASFESCMQAGANAFIRKPSTEKSISKTMDALLGFWAMPHLVA